MADRVGIAIGQQLGNYRLTRFLGGGGFADVYLGEHVHIDMQAAIKVQNTELGSECVEQFRTEAHTLARLVHPQIIRLLDFGIEGGLPFLVMDYAPNGSIRKHYPRGVALPLNVIASAVTQVAEALQYAHDQKRIHRDVKPDNMLIGRNNEVLLSDFGIAVLSQTSRSQSIEDGSGTPAYMAPEQIRGRARPASDQYSLGIVVYEWLSGNTPFHGASGEEIAYQHIYAFPPSLCKRIPTLSPFVEQVVFKALEKDPHKRFGNVREFSQALAVAIAQVSQAAYTLSAEFRPPIPNVKPTIQAPPESHVSPFQKTREQWVSQGNAYYKTGRYKEAIAEYSYAIALDPKYADAYFNRGNAYSSLKEYERAIADYDYAIALDPKSADAYAGRGNAYSHLKQYKQALADYNHAIRHDRKFVRAYNNRGRTYYDLEDYRRAIADFDRAIALDPWDSWTYGSRGLAYYCLKDHKRAIEDFDHALTLDPTLTWVKAGREKAYRSLQEQHHNDKTVRF